MKQHNPLQPVCLALLLMILSGCQVIGSNDSQATLQAANAQYLVEAQAIVTSAAVERTAVSGTAQAAQATIAYSTGINNQLNLTLQAITPPTVAIVPGPPMGPETSRAMPSGDPGAEAGSTGDMGEIPASTTDGSGVVSGNTQFVALGMSTSVSNADGCPTSVQTTFPASTQQLYATVRAYNITSGTPMRFEWYRDGQLAAGYDWTVNQSSADICLYYFVTPSDIAFTPGSWTVQIYASGTQVATPISFMITQ
ncbi:MAG: hypothetical protein SF029_04385 [bacterium]|nr:hypothetical protein [bacterium]